jgi:integrase
MYGIDEGEDPMKLELTDRTVATAKPGDLFDSRARGLNLRVTASGIRTWFLVYTAKNGKRARLTLGRYPEIGLARARTLAVEARQALQDGHDPREVRPSAGAMTLASLVDDFLAKHVRPKLRSAKAVERRLLKNAVPVIGDVKLAELHRRDVLRVLDPILERGSPIEALKVFKDLRAMLRWAVERGVLDACPMDGMKPPAEEKARERVLSDSEIATVWNSEALTKQAHREIIKLCLLTAQRVGEVAGMCMDEIDLQARTWTIPAERSKNKNRHAVPLSDAALAIIKSNWGRERLFHDTGDTSAIGKCIHRATWGIAPWTAHDLRRTAVTKMAELGVAPIVLGSVINHRSVTKAGVTLGVDVQHSYEREKREALEVWANRLSAIVSGDAPKIIPMRGGARG